FQIADDILDLEGSPDEVGKAVGKDAGAGKATVVAALGRAEAGRLLAQLVAQARAALEPFGARGAVLADAADFVAARRS
ncbi:MAG: geranylgeranyl pyrophosphate synthase, partial [Rhizobiales bacterium 32-66-8]